VKAEVRAMVVSASKSPLTPLFKGGNLLESFQNLPPFVKGDRGGFLRLGFAFSKQVSHVCIYEHSLAIAWAKPKKLETTQGKDLL
jgi:hypothetical protein